MNIEQLKMILDVLQSAGEGAYQFAIWWLVKDFAISIIGFGALFFFLILVYKFGKIAMLHSQTATRLEKLRYTMGIGSSGYLTTGEFNQIIQKIKEMKK